MRNSELVVEVLLQKLIFEKNDDFHQLRYLFAHFEVEAELDAGLGVHVGEFSRLGGRRWLHLEA